MKLAVLYVWGSLLTLTSSKLYPGSNQEAPQYVKLMPAGPCEDEDLCPYHITLPTLSIQLPKDFRDLDSMARELETLRKTVDQLRSCCIRNGQKMETWDRGGEDEQNIIISSRDGKINVLTGASEVPATEDHLGGTKHGAGLGSVDVDVGTFGGDKRHPHEDNNEDSSASKTHNPIIKKGIENPGEHKESAPHSADERVSKNLPPPTIGRTEDERRDPSLQNRKIHAQDCSDYTFGKPKRSGIFKVRPDLRNSPFLVFCDMDSYGGGWTLLQHRYDGSISFNRSWNDYKMGFGHLKGEFWLGNDKIHLLTKTEDMLLRIELEDIDGLKAHATYEHFFVASEQQLYRLSVGTYFGTAGNAMSFSDKFNHDQKYFSTPDRDNDMYASGNCGDYYSSGWWFDSCMAANLNGKYYKTQYKGVRNGIFWGTWPNISWEYYPTNYRQAFKTVKMMIRPKDYTL
uniref:Fibrinogen C-terminal domain-containing protein n=1 Tax=Denticeps clupeoides TaxID=299321 RepID=A0AAY4E0N5_9TELE